MPVRQARSGTRGRPPFGRHGGVGRNGSTRSHSGSGSSAVAIPVHATSPTWIRFRRFCYALLAHGDFMLPRNSDSMRLVSSSSKGICPRINVPERRTLFAAVRRVPPGLESQRWRLFARHAARNENLVLVAAGRITGDARPSERNGSRGPASEAQRGYGGEPSWINSDSASAAPFPNHAGYPPGSLPLLLGSIATDHRKDLRRSRPTRYVVVSR
jgi:hypothetical protein